jgi:type IV pilus assembly protein PilO
MKLSDLKKIDFKNPRIQAMAGIIVACVAVTALWYQYIFTEKLRRVEELKVEYQNKQDELNKINSMQPKLARLRDDIQVLQIQLDSLRSIFPDRKEIPKLIREITRVAGESGIFTSKFNPLPDVTREHYIENNYFMSVVGGYHSLASFFSYLAEFELIINLTNVSIRMNPGVSASIAEYEVHGGTIKTVLATFTMTTFSSKK